MSKPEVCTSLLQVKLCSKRQPASRLGLGATKTRTQIERAPFLPPQTNHPVSHLATSLCFAAVAAAAAARLISLLHDSRQEA